MKITDEMVEAGLAAINIVGRDIDAKDHIMMRSALTAALAHCDQEPDRAAFEAGYDWAITLSAPTTIREDTIREWRDISTAPKDCLIDIWIDNGNGEGVRRCDCYYDLICDEWRTSRPSGHLIAVRAKHVTHWMPLPAAPLLEEL